MTSQITWMPLRENDWDTHNGSLYAHQRKRTCWTLCNRWVVLIRPDQSPCCFGNNNNHTQKGLNKLVRNSIILMIQLCRCLLLGRCASDLLITSLGHFCLSLISSVWHRVIFAIPKMGGCPFFKDQKKYTHMCKICHWHDYYYLYF